MHWTPKVQGKKDNHVDQVVLSTEDLTLLVDASISENTRMIGLGATILTTNKMIQAGLSKPLKGVLSVFHAEALALLVGLRWTLSVGLPIKRIFSGSLALVQALESTNSYHNELGILLSNIKRLLGHFPDVPISHERRCNNIAAHNLDKNALQREEEFSWMEEFPFVRNNHIICR